MKTNAGNGVILIYRVFIISIITKSRHPLICKETKQILIKNKSNEVYFINIFQILKARFKMKTCFIIIFIRTKPVNKLINLPNHFKIHF